MSSPLAPTQPMDKLFHIGDVARFSATFTDSSSGAAVDPTTVDATVRSTTTLNTFAYPPAGGIQKDSTGHYHLDVLLSESGNWYCHVDGTGAAAGGGDQTIYVEPSVALGR